VEALADETKNKTSLRSSSFLLRVLLVVGGRSLFMGLLIFAVFAAVLLPYLLGLVVIHNKVAGLPLAMMCLLSL